MLLLPWLAMQFSDEMAWDLADFVLLGAMLLVACGTFQDAPLQVRIILVENLLYGGYHGRQRLLRHVNEPLGGSPV